MTLIDFEAEDRLNEILALLKMMQYAGGVANELDVPHAVSLIDAAQSALLAVLKAEFPAASDRDLSLLVDEIHGHC